MRKTLFASCAIAVLAIALVTGCSQPVTSMDVALTAPSAPEVNSELIKAEALDGFILVTWGAGDETDGYTVYRQEIYTADTDDHSAGDVVEGSLANLGSQSGYSPIKRIPYYRDSAIKNGAQYQYGIVNYGYQSQGSVGKPTSAIVWQEFDDEKPLATAKGKNETGLKVNRTAEIAFPTLSAVVKIDTYKSEAYNHPESIQYTVSGLKSGFYYEFVLQNRNTTSIYNSWGTIVDYQNPWYNQTLQFAFNERDSVNVYLDTGKWDRTITFDGLQSPSVDITGALSNKAYRLKVTVLVDTSYFDSYIDITPIPAANTDVSALPSNEKAYEVSNGDLSY